MSLSSIGAELASAELAALQLLSCAFNALWAPGAAPVPGEAVKSCGGRRRGSLAELPSNNCLTFLRH